MKASATQEDLRVTPHPASRRALQVELERTRAELATQDARLAKAGADLDEHKLLASELITQIGLEREARAVAERIASERAATIAKLERAYSELAAGFAVLGAAKDEAIALSIKLDRIAQERAAEVQRLEARVRELEPLAEVGRRICDFDEDALAALIRRVDGNHALGAGALAAIIHTHVRRAAGSGEEKP